MDGERRKEGLVNRKEESEEVDDQRRKKRRIGEQKGGE